MKILILRYSALGDVVLSTGLVRYIKQKIPQAEIDFLTSTHLKEIFSNNPDIRQVYGLAKGSTVQEIIQLYKSITQYDFIFDLQGNLKSKLLKLFSSANFNGIKKR